MEELLHTFHHAFPRDRDTLPVLGLALAVAAFLTLLLAASTWLRRRRAREERLAQLAAHRGLSPDDLRLALRLARRAGASPFVLLTHLDLFERATAGAEDPQGGVRRLREALGFDRLPAHAPLLTTRELAPGTAVAVGAAGLPGQVTSVDERSFAVELRSRLAVNAGEVLELELDHAHEARYRVRCPLLAERPRSGPALHLTLGHDEAPLRLQRRAFARVALRGPFELRPLAALVPHAASPQAWHGELVDVSGGGALLASAVPLPVGLLGRAAFAVGEERFEGLRAVVLSCASAVGGGFRARLELVRIPETQRDRLVVAVARATRAQLAAERAKAAEAAAATATPTARAGGLICAGGGEGDDPRGQRRRGPTVL